jgi:methyl-accepting chemotaxis protein
MIDQVSARMDVAATTIPQALSNQTAFVEEVSATINNMNEQMKNTLASITKVNAFTGDLYHLAEDSSTGIRDSKETISKMGGYSQFLTDVLVIIEDITERTGILAINAAIESARRGSEGRGFSVIANEIRSLANQSKQSLDKSFSQLGEMHKVIEKGILLSDDVNAQLLKIIDNIKQVSEKIDKFTQVISEQKEQSSNIHSAVKELLKDTFTIKNLSENEQQENGKIKQSLTALQSTFAVIDGLLKSQIAQGQELKSRMDDIKNVTKENLDNITLLNSSLDTAAMKPGSAATTPSHHAG